MTARGSRWRWAVAQLGLLGFCLGASVTGCGGQGVSQEQEQTQPTTGQTSQQGNAPGSPTAGGVPLDPRLHQPFKDAVSLEPGSDPLPPPDVTRTGKVVGKLYEAIAGGLWDQVKFATPTGRRLNYAADVKTDLGTVTVELWPDVAPNHVRNFVALARAGYYDGLEFDRLHREKSNEEEGKVLEYVQAGSPLGVGDDGDGSIGYWLQPELNPQLKHEEGTVAAWHGYELETAACKFYITLTKAPVMDGNFTIFGKVTNGLDVLREISKRPTQTESGREDQPREPVVMRSVTIRCTEADRATGPAN